MSDPEVSVVIPAYNAEKFIRQALDSVLAQTFTRSEIIVVDDGSTDGTAAAVATFGDRVRYIRQQNGGAAAARNTAMRAARAPWVAFLDSDDEWQIDHVELLLRSAAASPDAHLVYGRKIWVDEQGTPIPYDRLPAELPAGWIFGDLFEACVISTCSTVLARTATMLELHGFNEDKQFKVTQDYDLYLRLAARHAIATAPEIRVRYRRHGGNLTEQSASYALGVLAALRTGDRLLGDGRVAPENHPERIDVRGRMRRAYQEAVVNLFNIGDYQAVKEVGFEAMGRGLGTLGLAGRSMATFLPGAVLSGLRNSLRRLRGTEPPPPPF